MKAFVSWVKMSSFHRLTFANCVDMEYVCTMHFVEFQREPPERLRSYIGLLDYS